MGEMSKAHASTYNHACTHIAGARTHTYVPPHIYIYAVGGESGHILPSRKGDLVPGVRPDSPGSGFALVL